MQLDGTPSSSQTVKPSNVTPLFRRERVRLHDGQTTSKALERRWNNRLQLLLKAEFSLQRANCLRAFSLTLIVIAALTLGFSLYTAPVVSPWVFIAEVSIIALGSIMLPACLWFSKECRRHRDQLSRKFYESNHEVEYRDDALVLINRSTYTAVTKVLFTDI